MAIRMAQGLPWGRSDRIGTCFGTKASAERSEAARLVIPSIPLLLIGWGVEDGGGSGVQHTKKTLRKSVFGDMRPYKYRGYANVALMEVGVMRKLVRRFSALF